MTSTRFVVAAMLAVPLACDDNGVDDHLDARQAQTSWSAANHAAASAHSDFSGGVVLGQHGEVRLACDDGGTLHMSGVMNGANDFALDVRYDVCVEDGVVLDGDLSIVAVLEEAFEVDVGIEGDGNDDVEDDDDDDVDEPYLDIELDDHDGGEARVIIEYEGVLHLDGDVEGKCVIDAEITAYAVLFERFASASASVAGRVCGHAAKDIVNG